LAAFKNTRLWQTSLALGPDPAHASEPLKQLHTAFINFRERAAQLAGEINRDLPDYTVHDITHVDALWNVADQIVGSSFPPLTPAEAFVLGGAFLIHDLGMGLAAYQNGIDTLRGTPTWQDAIVNLLEQKLGRQPSPDEIRTPSEEIERQAIRQALRDQHAQHAEDLLSRPFRDRKGDEEYYLIDRPELRKAYGQVIGEIAASHGWSIEKVDKQFDTLPRGSLFVEHPDWTVDQLKLACLLRVADACQLAGRAPGFLRALRKPASLSKSHWIFQENLLYPQSRIDSNRLVYTTARSFPVDDMEAWWLCFDTLRMADGELRRSDTLLADSGRPRLAAHGIAGVEEPERLRQLIPTKGWTPIDTRIKITSVTDLVRKLGGEELYGHDPIVPLRELIQNASDAVRARRLIEDYANDWGSIDVRLGEDTDGSHWIEVEDNGVGMSATVLTGDFLDFGTSYWGSALMRQELPGLQAKGFKSTGKYGIGFFSVFMWGNRVRVTTRHYLDAPRDTLVLEFGDGLNARPFLREARADEFIRDGGTRVRVWLKAPPHSREGLLRFNDNQKWNLAELCAWLCPALDVDLFTGHKDKRRKKVVSASDWIKLDGRQLLKRITHRSESPAKTISAQKLIDAIHGNLRLLTDAQGQVSGRACVEGRLINEFSISSPGVVTVGGIRAASMGNIGGIFIGTVKKAARDTATPVVERNELVRWASEQSELVYKTFEGQAARLETCAQIIRQCGGDVGNLPIACGARGWLSARQIQQWPDLPDEVLLVTSFDYKMDMFESFVFNDNVLMVESSRLGIVSYHARLGGLNEWPPSSGPESPLGWDNESLVGAVVEALAKAWSLPIKDVVLLSDFSDSSRPMTRRVIGVGNGQPVTETVYVIRKP